MKTLHTRRAGRLILALALASALGGCAVYEPAPAYYDDGGVVYGGPSVYVAPLVYVAPPTYYFGFSSWGGHRGYGHGWHDGPARHGGHGWRR